MDRLRARGEIGRRAVVRYTEALAEAWRDFRGRRDAFGSVKCRVLFWRLMRWHRDWLRADDWVWGKTGYALTTLGKYRAAEKWLADWRQRPGAQPWMLHNLVWALQHNGRGAETHEVIRHALTLPGRDDSRARFQLWTAIEEALTGNVPAANERLAVLKGGPLEDYDQTLRTFLGVLLEFQPPDGGKREFTREHARQLAEFRSANRHNRAMRHALRRGLRLIARSAANRWAVERTRWASLLSAALAVGPSF